MHDSSWLAQATRHGVPGHFRFGDLPEHYNGTGTTRVSLTRLHGTDEYGVAVYDGWIVGEALVIDLRGLNTTVATSLIGARPPHQITGGRRLVVRGGDGEPLLVDEDLALSPHGRPTGGNILHSTRLTPSEIGVVFTWPKGTTAPA